ncbi:3414_t:CDS:2, partial [Dentiscutata erythropus]
VEPQKKPTVNEVPDTYYGLENSEDLVTSQDCISRSELDHLINGYLEVLDDFMFKPLKGQENEDRPKKYKASNDEVESTNTDKKVPEFDDFVLNLIDDYLGEEPVVKREKEAIQEPAKV